MEYLDTENSLFKELKPVINGLGYDVVEFHTRVKEGKLNLSLRIYKPDGITIDDCTLVHRTIYPRIEIMEEIRNINLEISSPGTSRKIKSLDEFSIFTGRNVSILPVDDSEWIRGTIQSAEDEILTVKTKEDTVSIKYSDIKKAKLE